MKSQGDCAEMQLFVAGKDNANRVQKRQTCLGDYAEMQLIFCKGSQSREENNKHVWICSIFAPLSAFCVRLSDCGKLKISNFTPNITTMRRLAFLLACVFVCFFAAASDADDRCSALSDALIAGDFSRAEDLANELYVGKSNCSAANLADLAIAYHMLAEKAPDAVSRYDFVLKTIDSYRSAAKKDAAEASARFKEKGTDMAAVVADYEANLGEYQKAVADSMNF